jgi:hypothetical protein
MIAHSWAMQLRRESEMSTIGMFLGGIAGLVGVEVRTLPWFSKNGAFTFHIPEGGHHPIRHGYEVSHPLGASNCPGNWGCAGSRGLAPKSWLRILCQPPMAAYLVGTSRWRRTGATRSGD